MAVDTSLLLPLGWSNRFLQQLSLEQLETARPARVTSVARNHFHVTTGDASLVASLSGHYRYQHHDEVDYPTVGDWVLLHPTETVIEERLERHNLITRRAAGSSEVQAIAANIDLMIIVSGLDDEFNLHRIERFLVIAAQAQVTPMVVLTKLDLCPDAEARIQAMHKRLPVEIKIVALNALQDPLAEHIQEWLQAGTTLTVVGSSGVGKSTLVNNLLGHSERATSETRADAKGRHTTTSRDLIRLPGGACIIDVPGIREVGLAPTEGGVETHFSSITEFAQHCRFADCQHDNEPGCAVRAALERGELDEDVWQHYLKLKAEERHNIAEHEKRREGRIFGRMVKEVKSIKAKQKKPG